MGDVTHAGALERLAIRYEWPDSRTAAPRQPLPTKRGRVVFAWSAAGGKVDAARTSEAHRGGPRRRAGLLKTPPDDAFDVVANASARRRPRAPGAPGPPASPSPSSTSSATAARPPRAPSGSRALRRRRRRALDLVGASRLQQLLAPYAGLVRLVVAVGLRRRQRGRRRRRARQRRQALHRAGFPPSSASRLPLSWDGARAFARALYEASCATSPGRRGLLAAARSPRLAPQLRLGEPPALRPRGRRRRLPLQRPPPTAAWRAFSPEHALLLRPRRGSTGSSTTSTRSSRRAAAPPGGVGRVGHGQVVDGARGRRAALRARMGDARFAWAVVRPGGGFDEALRAADAALAAAAGRERFLSWSTSSRGVHPRRPGRGGALRPRALWRRAQAPVVALCVLATLRLDFLARCGEVVLDDQGSASTRWPATRPTRCSCRRCRPRSSAMPSSGPRSPRGSPWSPTSPTSSCATSRPSPARCR